jgi:hypothetical protein
MKPHRLRGFWWISSKPEKHVPGILRMAPAGNISLYLHGALTADSRMADAAALTIFGTTIKGRFVTLQKCYEVYVIFQEHSPSK